VAAVTGLTGTTPVLLTRDNEATAAQLARQVGVTDVRGSAARQQGSRRAGVGGRRAAGHRRRGQHQRRPRQGRCPRRHRDGRRRRPTGWGHDLHDPRRPSLGVPRVAGFRLSARIGPGHERGDHAACRRRNSCWRAATAIPIPRPRRAATPSPDRTHPGGRRQDLHRFHCRRPHQPRALLVIRPPVHVGVGLVMLGRQPGPAGQLLRASKPRHIVDLGNQHRGPYPGSVAAPHIPGHGPAGLGTDG